MEYTIRERYYALKSIEREKVRAKVCQLLNIKPQAFYKRLRGEYEDLSGAELNVWKEVFQLKNIDALYPTQKV